MLINGKWHAEGSAEQFDAALRSNDDQVTVAIDDGRMIRCSFDELKVSDRLGNVERKITLNDGSIFATRDNESIDQLFKKDKSVNGFIHKIESNIGWVVVALLVTIGTSGAFLKWGVPWTSNKLAHALPHSTNELIAAQTLDFLDKYFFDKDSDVDPAQMEQIREHFNTRLVPLAQADENINFQLHFRKWEVDGQSIPNAFALPSGDIILTDKFVELTENQDEIDAVLLHEIGHVAHRHTLQLVIQGTMLTTIVMIVTGDSSTVADMGLGLGTLMISSGYARGYESEADVYAFEKMLQAKIDPQAFSDIIDRMTKYMETSGAEVIEDKSETEVIEKSTEQNTPELAEDKKTVIDYLSSHPSTEDRIRQAEHYSNCFSRGLTICPPLNSQ